MDRSPCQIHVTSKMRRHKIVVQIILLILSVINFALAAPVSVRGIAEDVTTASRKRWNPPDKWWTNAADRTNTPSSLGSSNSDYRLDSEQELRPHDPRSPMDSYPSTPGQPHGQASLGSTDSDSSYLGSPPPAHNNPLGIDLNDAAPQPGPTDDQPPPVPPSDPGRSKRPSSQPDPGPSKRPYILSDPGLSSWASGPGPLTWTLGSEPSTWALGPSDPGPPIAHSPPSPGPLQHESENLFSELFRGSRFKRRISGSRSVNTALRELQYA
jgi:hypothetical protein